MNKPLLLICVSALALSACNTSTSNTAATEQKQSSDAGIETGWMDKSVQPGDDFNAFANGNYVKTAQIPADRSNVGAFSIARDAVEKQNLGLIDALVKANPDESSNEGKIVAAYKAFTDQAAIDKAGMAPVKPDLDRFASIKDKGQLSEILGSQIRADVDPFNATDFDTENLFGIFVTQGLATPGEVIPYILQGGISLPDRDYYLSADKDKADIRAAYRPYIQQIFSLAGYPDAAARAQRVYDLEMKIARAHATREESNDFSKASTVWTRQQLEKNAPGLDWGRFLGAAQLNNQGKFDAYEPGAIRGLSALVASEPLDAWKDWLIFHQINSHASVLPSSIDNANFAFFGTKLNGQPQQLPRNKRALATVNTYLGDAVGKAYADKYFPASAKSEIQQMVVNIKAAFAARVKALSWMAPATKAEALKKVETIEVGVGYPDQWRDYGSLQLGPDAYANEIAAQKANYAAQLAKIGKPMDRKEWWMTPQTVNAVNLPVQNALNFPAGILQRPFFDANADAAYNYGAIGSVIGHEISHSFDNNGAMFDSRGVLRNWWTPADLARFTKAADALAAQYDAYEALPGLHLNGKLELGENIADVAGLAAAYDAYKTSLGGKAAPVIDGLTGDQRFFIAYAQTRAGKMRDGYLRQLVATNGHAPSPWRALTVRNVDAWYNAFGVKPGQKLYLAPDKRVKVWG